MMREFPDWEKYGKGVQTICKNGRTSDFEPYLFDKNDPNKILFSDRYTFERDCDDMMRINWPHVIENFETKRVIQRKFVPLTFDQ